MRTLLAREILVETDEQEATSLHTIEGAFLEKRLARLDKGEATKRISAARENRGKRHGERQKDGKLMQQKQAAQGGPGRRMPSGNGGGGHRNKH